MPVVAGGLKKRRAGQPAEVIAVADKAMKRLYRRFWRMSEKGKPTPKIVVAIARELVGFIWAALHPLALRSAACTA
jgi:hypothetical protein